jgi:hypothetical protein
LSAYPSSALVGAITAAGKEIGAYLGILAAFEKRGHPDEPNIVIPHDGILGVIPWSFEPVLEHCRSLISFGGPLDGFHRRSESLFTFEALSAGLLVKVLLTTIIGDMSTIVLDTAQGGDGELPGLLEGFRV